MLHCVPEVAQHLEALLHGAVEILVVFLNSIAAFFLGAIKRNIGVFKNAVGIGAVVGEGGRADGGADLEILVEDLERFGADDAQDTLGDVARGVDVGRERHHDGEFICVHPGDNSGFRHRGAQALADAFQNRVADIVTH